MSKVPILFSGPKKSEFHSIDRMNYYPFHIGDFRSGTVNMSRQSRWIYRDMLDVYYDTEKPLALDLDALCDGLGVELADERSIVERLLRFKFTKTEDGYHHEICDRVIAEYRAKAETAKTNGAKGGRPKGSKNNPNNNQEKPSGFPSGSDVDASGKQEQTGSNANQEPITKNHEPKTKGTAEARGSRLPSDWHPSDDDTAFCKAERPDLRPSEVAKRFYDYWIAIPGAKGRKLDWPATWRQWVRNEREERRGAARTAGAGSDKFQVAGLDHSSTRTAMEESMARHGITVPDNDDEIEI